MPAREETWRVKSNTRKGVLVAEGFIEKQGAIGKSWDKRWAKLILDEEHQESWLIYFSVTSKQLAESTTQDVMAWLDLQLEQGKSAKEAWEKVLSVKGEVPIHSVGKMVLHQGSDGTCERLDLAPPSDSTLDRTWHLRRLPPKGDRKHPIFDAAWLETWAEHFLRANHLLTVEPPVQPAVALFLKRKKTYGGIQITLIARMPDKSGRFAGNAYLMTQAQAQGAAGKFKVGTVLPLSGGGAGETKLMAIKEWRTAWKTGQSKFGLGKTQPSDAEEIRRELKLSELTGGKMSLFDAFEMPLVGNAGSKYYAVMALHYGCTEATLTALRGAPFAASRNSIVRFVLRDVARDLAEMHRRGYAHYDIKPANLLLDEDAAYLTDFGQTDNQPRKGYGTPQYSAPESDGEAFMPSDLFALGLTWCQIMRDGCPLLAYRWGVAEDKTYATTHYANLGSEEYFRQLRAADPEMYQFVYGRMLHPEPAARCSAAELAGVADALLGTGGVNQAKAGLTQLLAGAKQRYAAIRAALTEARRDSYWMSWMK